jgi:hypothetical protein
MNKINDLANTLIKDWNELSNLKIQSIQSIKNNNNDINDIENLINNYEKIIKKNSRKFLKLCKLPTTDNICFSHYKRKNKELFVKKLMEDGFECEEKVIEDFALIKLKEHPIWFVFDNNS